MRPLFLYFCLGLFLLPLAVEAQLHGNEWINYNQQYVKIPVGQEGIYRISYQDLQAAGFPVSSVNPRNLQLFHRGKEQAIFVEGEGNFIFDPADYILFYGQKNDGAQDAELYFAADAQPHTHYNLYSDSTAYFLTFNLTNQAGKRMGFFSENNTYGLSPEPFHFEERLLLYTNDYSAGLVHPYAGEFKTYLTYGDYGEGFTGPVISNGQTQDITFSNLSGIVSAGPAPELELLLQGRNNLDRTIDVLAGATASSLQGLHQASFNGGRHYRLKEKLNWNMLSGGQSVVRVATDAGERVSVSFARLRYAQVWDMQGAYEKIFRLPAGTGNRRYIEVKNVPSGVKAFDVSSPENIIQIGLKRLDASTVAAIIPPGATEREILFSGVEVKPAAVRKVSFRKIEAARHNYLIVTHASLRKGAGGYPDPVKAYAAYRASAEGGGFDTLLVNMDQLYNQFSYGEISPVAIRRLVTYMADGGEPAYLFLIGKALDVYYNYHRSTNWTSPHHDLVPTFGYPGGDIPFTAQLKGLGYMPAFPVGRIGAHNPQEVANYLNKVKEMEASPLTDTRRKNIVHLSGGASESQAAQFRRYLKEFENIAEGPYLGGHVETVSKNADVVVQEIDITRQVNQGVGLVTFFGHSGPYLSDMEIGYVSDDRSGYRNKGKYPCILVNGCDAGDIFSTSQYPTFGEDWTLTAGRGAHSFIAHSGIGYTDMLRRYTENFYQTAYADTNYIAASVGKIQAEAIRRFLSEGQLTPVAISQAQQMVLQGDPAVRLFGVEKADYEIDNNRLYVHSYSGEQVKLSADSFAVAIIAQNFGRVYLDSMEVRLTIQEKGSNNTLVSSKKFKAPFYRDTLFYSIQSESLGKPGMYQFSVQLNPESEIPEINYTNNQASLEVLLNFGGTINLLPHQYAIVGKPEARLFFQGTDLFGKGNQYLLEMDTSGTFNSSSLQKYSLQGDVLINFKAGLSEVSGGSTDSVTYFWRTKLAQGDTSWVRSSFSYIKEGEEGWTQRHSRQFSHNDLKNISVAENRKWTFNNIRRHVEVITVGAQAPAEAVEEVELKIDEVGYILGTLRGSCRSNSINAVHFNKNLEPLIALHGGVFNDESCGRAPEIVNNFIEKDIVYGNNDGYNLEKYLADVPEGHYVLLFSMGSVNYTLWPSSVKDQLLSLGATPEEVAALADGEPFIMLGRKGMAAGSAVEVYAQKGTDSPPAAEQTIRLDHIMEGKAQQATITTDLIGPAADWRELACLLASEVNDRFSLQVIGVNAQMQEQPLFVVNENQSSLPLSIDARQYPYLKLKLDVEDGVEFTPPQLKYWQVLFSPLPEGVLLPADSLPLHAELEEGQEYHPAFRFINISDRTFADTSLQVNYRLSNNDQQKNKEAEMQVTAPGPSDTTYFSMPIGTDSWYGLNDFTVQVNPQIVPEMYYNNNRVGVSGMLSVRKDTLQPIIDVAFDGLYITNGAIVSPTPLVSIILRDENKFKLKQDTTGVYIYLKKECEGCAFERVDLAASKVRWQPATENESFRIEFEPEALSDGMYTLQIQAEDASGNRAGKEPYSINFEVITESTITRFYPYPNPFSTATRFVFTLTGSEVPDDIKIQIMTVDGRVVREVLMEELGPIRIGHNITDFAWDGRDEWGDQLANGVYLYKVFIRHSGDNFESRATKGDKAFKQDFGKLYLLR